MDNKLTLKDLSVYLPYKLKMIFEKSGRIIELTGICETDYGNLIYETSDKDYGSALFNFKPILVPLSDLTQEELIQGKFNSHIDYLTHELQNPANKTRLGAYGKPLWRVEHAPYEMIEYLFSKHYDVFGLIDKKLAISIHDIN